MNKIKFWKYQGAGNDFIMVDQRIEQKLSRSDVPTIARLCDRRFGIGGDGLILLQLTPGYDFEMIYFNSDGRESSMCGNGGRCIAAFARQLGIINDSCHFLAIDGPHDARIKMVSEGKWWVELKMSDVRAVEQHENVFVLNTGSPHFVRFENHLDQLDVVREGRAIRYSDRFKKDGINVNLVEVQPDGLEIRTYERGVEDETLACGTGVTAAALAHFLYKKLPAGRSEIPVHAKGGDLAVRFEAHADGAFSDIWLIGPAENVFEGITER
jgi:diaminopimelate epimerase